MQCSAGLKLPAELQKHQYATAQGRKCSSISVKTFYQILDAMKIKSTKALAVSALGLCILVQGKDCPDYDCPAKEGSYADPCSCKRFYQCVDSSPVKTFCPSGLWWDDVK